MDILEYLKELHDLCLDLSTKIEYDRKHKLHFNLMAINGSLIELTACIIVLSEKHRIGIPILFRSAIEAFVDLSNLIKDKKYGYYMDINDNEQWLKILHEANKGINPYLSSYKKIPNLDKVVKVYEKKNLKLKSNGYKKLNIFEKFDMVDMEDIYRSIYPFLCMESHGSIGALINRHADIDKQSKDYELVYYNDKPIETYIQYFDSLAGILLKVSEMLHDYFDTGFSDTFREMGMRLEEMRKTYV